MSDHAHQGTGYHHAHHFDSLGQQQSTVRLGMWLFLVTEVLFFGGIMCAYTAYRVWFPKDFEAGSAALNPAFALVNTFLLLTSSLTITLAIRACYEGKQASLSRYLMATILLGSLFLGFKAYEYYQDFQEGLTPTKQMVVEDLKVIGKDANGKDVVTYEKIMVPKFDKSLKTVLSHAGHEELYEQCNPARVQLFFLFYYAMTGLHVIHMIIGLGLLLWQYILTNMGFFNHKERYVYIEVMSLYWHFVDMVWMFLLPLLYLAGPHSFDHLHFFGGPAK